jgi:hypothetical protein
LADPGRLQRLRGSWEPLVVKRPDALPGRSYFKSRPSKGSSAVCKGPGEPANGSVDGITSNCLVQADVDGSSLGSRVAV